jgi:hypothetical protein
LTSITGVPSRAAVVSSPKPTTIEGSGGVRLRSVQAASARNDKIMNDDSCLIIVLSARRRAGPDKPGAAAAKALY